MPAVSIIITTYNRADALRQILCALNDQSSLDFEVIIADDGSDQRTADMLNQYQSRLAYPLVHIWQEDCGFRAARARNLAVTKASSDYLVFLDGDCLPLADFVVRHLRLRKIKTLVAGNRILLSAAISQNLPPNIWRWSLSQWLTARLKGDINRLLPLLKLPSSLLARLPQRQTWHGVKTCNLGLWKSDFLAVNGFNEAYNGWGHEDADLAVRLLKYGIKRQFARFAIPVLHLWHPQNDRSNEAANRQRLKQILRQSDYFTPNGINQHMR